MYDINIVCNRIGSLRQMTSNLAMEIHHFDWSKSNVYISDQKRALSKQTPLRQYLAEVN